MGRDQPYIADYLQCHSIAVVLYNNRGVGCVYTLQGDSHIFGIGVVGVLYQFEHRKARTTNKLITKQLKQPGSWAKREVKFFCVHAESKGQSL